MEYVEALKDRNGRKIMMSQKLTSPKMLTPQGVGGCGAAVMTGVVLRVAPVENSRLAFTTRTVFLRKVEMDFIVAHVANPTQQSVITSFSQRVGVFSVTQSVNGMLRAKGDIL